LFLSTGIYSQISPGALTKAHADLEGLSNCTKCHQLGEQVFNSKCLDCHTEIKTLIDENRGYHSSTDVRGKDCWSCHSEHHGRNFRIVNFDPNSFNHSKTGFELKDAHQKAECKDCHQSKHISDSKLKLKSGTYLGLSQYCFSCHEDYHLKTLSDDCSACHDSKAFRPAPGFNHNKAQFKLTGAHIKVDCISCHPKEIKNSKETQKFKGIAFANCNSCHTDVHQGRFGNDCKSCHSTVSFKTINQSAFDHNRTNYPLIGNHKSVSCNSCHKSEKNRKPAYQKCTDCHKDYHNFQFIIENKIRDCEDCHTVYGFRPSTYTMESHNKSKFKLTGAHLAVPCESCHLNNENIQAGHLNWSFRDIGLDCIECHENIHNKELKVEYLPENDCRACHRTDNWSVIDFDHDKTNFQLKGKHLNSACRDCHYSNKEIESNKIIFSSLNPDCETCHTDIHYGQFSVNNKTDCSECHTFENWKPENFDHNKTRFKLEGAHQKVDCIRCHAPTQVNGIIFIQYKLEDFRCITCHS
jgi:hypothetical protein